MIAPVIESTRDVQSPRVRYAFFVERGAGLLYSASSGVRVESLCIAKCVAATFVATGFLLYLVAVKPAAERSDHWFGLVFATLQVGSSVFVTADVVVGGTVSRPLLDAPELINLVTSAVLVVQAIVDLCTAWRASDHRSGTKRGTPPTTETAVPMLSLPVSTTVVARIDVTPTEPVTPTPCKKDIVEHYELNETSQPTLTTNPLLRRPSACLVPPLRGRQKLDQLVDR
jgi:hypothetical protein